MTAGAGAGSGARDVVVVGAGPAGLVVAITLARAGVPVTVVDRRGGPSSAPKATVVSTSSMELFRSWGLEPAVRAGGQPVEWQLWTCPALVDADAGFATSIGYPTVAQSAVVSPTAPACVPQDHLEAVLLDELRSYASATVHLRTEVIAVETGERDRGPSVTLLSHGGTTEMLDAPAVIAADGVHSTVRGLLGIKVKASPALATGLNVIFRAPMWRLVGEHRYGIYTTTGSEPPGTLIPAGVNDRWQMPIELQPGESRADYPAARLVAMVRRFAGVPGLDVRIENAREVVLRTQLASTWRVGDVHLVGDAAHTSTPRGGTGMNTAIAGARDLGWRLVWVMRGWAGAELLDGYEAERRPVAERNLARSADPGGTRRAVLGELEQDLGGRIAHSALPDGSSTLDLLTDGLTLLTSQPSWAPLAERAASPAPITVRVVPELVARVLGVARDGALLARPDGRPVALWSRRPAHPGALTDAALAVSAEHRSAA
jgi:2-polyprenyl-6-methoxyphenol hydroxylase-like FAD-dependent oxidoreductase